MLSRPIRFGNSRDIVLDRELKAVFDLVNIREGDFVTITTDGTSVVISPTLYESRTPVISMTAQEALMQLNPNGMQQFEDARNTDPDFDTKMEAMMPEMLKIFQKYHHVQAKMMELGTSIFDEATAAFAVHGDKALFIKQINAARAKACPESKEMDREMLELSIRHNDSWSHESSLQEAIASFEETWGEPFHKDTQSC